MASSLAGGFFDFHDLVHRDAAHDRGPGAEGRACKGRCKRHIASASASGRRPEAAGAGGRARTNYQPRTTCCMLLTRRHWLRAYAPTCCLLQTTHCWLRTYALLATLPPCTRRAPELTTLTTSVLLWTRRAPELTTLTTSVLLWTRRAPEGLAEQQGAHGGFDGGVEHEGDDDDDEEGDLRRVQRLEDLRRTGSRSGSGSGPWSEVGARVGVGVSGLRSA